MKKVIFVISVVIGLTSCKKDGYIYKCSYTTPNTVSTSTFKPITTSFFIRDVKDSVAAVNWFKQTEGYKLIEGRADSIWIEYYCPASEWK